MAQNLFFARIGDARREYVGKGHRCLEKRHVGPKENSLCSDKVDATLEDETMMLRAGQIEKEIGRNLCRFYSLHVAAPGDAGVAQQNSGAGMSASDLRKQQRAAVRVRTGSRAVRRRFRARFIVGDG